jgi:acyl-CoA-binding protein
MPSFSSSSPLPPAAASAVSALEAVGTDLDALAAAIGAAAFLDKIPGSARQALRGKRGGKRKRKKKKKENGRAAPLCSLLPSFPLTVSSDRPDLFPLSLLSSLSLFPTQQKQPTAARTRLRKALADAAAKAQAAAASAAADASPFAKPSYDAAEFAALASGFESLAWRAIAKPGGATVKPDPYYELLALNAQAKTGDVVGERPMWAERGGLDFDGRARWDAHAALRGVSKEEAKLRFVKLYCEFSPRALYSEGRGKK